MRKRNVRNNRKSNKPNTNVSHINIDEKSCKGDCQISPIIESLNESKPNNIVSITDNPFDIDSETEEEKELSVIKIDTPTEIENAEGSPSLPGTPPAINYVPVTHPVVNYVPVTPPVVNYDGVQLDEYDREVLDEYILVDKIIDDLGEKINEIDKERFIEGFIRKLLLNAF